MSTEKAKDYMLRFRSHETHLAIEELNRVWPNLSQDQYEHLNYCDGCQKLVADSFPIFYLGPVHDIIYREKSKDKASAFILEELESRFKSGCFDIFAGSLFLSSITRKNLNHIQSCQTCRKLIDYLSRSGGSFAKSFGGLHQNFLTLVEMNWEISELTDICRGGPWNKETPECRNCWDYCLNPIDIGRDRVILAPQKNEQPEHIKNCNHCQLILRYHQLQGQSMSFRHDCFDAKAWKLFPVYSENDQRDLEKHVFGCYFCSPRIVSALRINFQRDKLAFQEMASRSVISRNLETFARNTRRPIGDFISSCRFHFGGDGPFATRHPWSIWGPTDRMAKLVKGKGLSDKETLYKKAIIGEIGLDELCNQFPILENPEAVR